MKKLLGTFLCLVLAIAALSACTPNEETTSNTTSSESTSSTAEYSDAFADKETARMTFAVNDTMPSYEAVVVLNGDGAAETLAVCDAATGEVLQSIAIEGDENCPDKQPHAIDVNFDGNKDILVPYMQTSRADLFHAYVWDAGKSEFVYAPSFAGVANFVLDTENKRLLGYSMGDMRVNYAVAVYDAEAKDFVFSNSLYYEYLTDEDGDTIHFVEYEKDEIVAEYTMPGNGDYYLVDETDDRMKPYLQEGSFWDLYSEKWHAYALKEGTSEPDFSDTSSEESGETSEAWTDDTEEHITELASDLFEDGYFWGQNGEWLYYADEDGILLGRVHLDGTERQKYDNAGITSANVEHDRIYYVDTTDGNHLYAMEHDGTDVTLLCDGKVVGGIEIVGGRIYFWLESDIPDTICSGNLSLSYSIMTDGTDLREEAYTVPQEDGWVYTYVDAYGDRRMCKIRPNGSEQTVLTEFEVDSYEVYGDWIYYTLFDTSDAEIGLFKIKTDGTENQKICDDDVYLDSTHWDTTLFDQSRVYYLLHDDNGIPNCLYTINQDGTDRNLISEKNVAGLLYASQDTVFYTVSEGEEYALYAVEADGTNERFICMLDHIDAYGSVHPVWRTRDGIIYRSNAALYFYSFDAIK